MADRSKKISELAAATSVAANDLIVIVDKHSSNTISTTKSANVSVLFGNVTTNVTLSNNAALSVSNVMIKDNSTPANSSITVAQGKIWADANYIYVATANNTVKRVSLSSF